MKTTTNLLPVYNALYNLGLTEEQMERLVVKQKRMDNHKFNYFFVKNNNLFLLYCSTPYYGGNIDIYSKDTLKPDPGTGYFREDSNAINALLASHAEGYIPRNSNSCFIIGEKFLENFGQQKKDYIWATLRFIENSDQGIVKELRRKSDNVKYTGYGSLGAPILVYDNYFNRVSDLKKAARKLFSNSFFFDNMLGVQINENGFRFDNTLNYLRWVFDMDDPKILNADTKNSETDNKYIFTIDSVYEEHNTRISVVSSDESGNNTKFYLVGTPESSYYSFMDVGRKFHYDPRKVPKSRRGDNDMDITPKLFILSPDVYLPEVEEIYTGILKKHEGDDAFLADSLTINVISKKLSMNKKKMEQLDVQKKNVRTKFSKKIEVLNTLGTEFLLNGIKCFRDKMIYEGQELSCDLVYIPKLLEKYTWFQSLDDVNFDKLSERFYTEIQSIFNYTSEALTSVGKIGDVNVTIENRPVINSKGHTMRAIYINNVKVNVDEIAEVLERALCYDNQKGFDLFLKEVSKCSLRIHKYLNNGIHITARDEFKDSIIQFKIPLSRKSGVNYITIGKEAYRVSDTNRLLLIENRDHIHEIINILLNPDIVSISGPDDIAYIINKGEALRKEDMDRNYNMIKKVEDLFNLETQTVSLRGVELRGYEIQGHLGKYFLDIGRTDKRFIFDRLSVFTYPSMKHICMIDKGIQQSGPSNLINRIYALHNDAMVAKDIPTLKDL